MPFIDETEEKRPEPFLTPDSLAAISIDEDGPGIGATAAASFRQDNVMTSTLNEIQNTPEFTEEDPTHNPLDLIEGTKFEQSFLDRFHDSRNEAETLSIMGEVEQEIQDRETIDSAGVLGFVTSLAAGIFDLPTLIPGGAAVQSLRVGKASVQSALKIGGLSGVAAVGAEAALQATQQTRTPIESGVNIAGSVLLGGILGTAIGVVGARQMQRLSKEIADDLVVPEVASNDVIDPGNLGTVSLSQGSAGAASVRVASTVKSAGKAEKVTGFKDPTITMVTSESPSAQLIAEDLAELPYTLEKNVRGEPTAPASSFDGAPVPGSVEARVRLHNANLAQAINEADEFYTRHRFGRDKVPLGRFVGEATGRLGLSPSGKLSYSEFKTRVAQALRRGDVDEIPEVAAAARVYRKKVFDPLKALAVDLKLLPEGVEVKTADSYLNRVYNTQKIISQRGDFKDIVLKHVKNERDKAQVRVEQPVDLVDAKVKVNELRDQVREVIRERDGPIKELSKKLFRKRGQAQQAQRSTRRAETGVRQAERRIEDLTPTEIEDVVDKQYFRDLLNDLKRGVDVVTIQDDIRSLGGIKDPSGEIKAIIGKSRSGLINSKSGLDPDDMTRVLWEEGYFNDRPLEDITQDDLFDALREDIGGNQQVSVFEESQLERKAVIDSLREDLAKQDFEIVSATPAKLKSHIEGAEFKEATPFVRGKLREAKSNLTKATNRLFSEDENALKTLDDVQELETALRLARTKGKDKTEAATGLRKELRKALTERKKQKRIADIDEFRAGRDDLELDDISERIIDRIVGTPGGRLPYDTANQSLQFRTKGGRKVSLPGPLKGRVFNIPDEMIEDFLENDIELLSRIYTRSLAPDLELTRKFGSPEMTAQESLITEDFNKLIANATDDKARRKLEARKNDTIRSMLGIRDRLRGTYALPDNPDGIMHRAARAVVNLNYLRLLGGMTISAIPDVARPVMVHGLTRVFRDGFMPLLRNFRAARVATDEIRKAGTALDMVMDTRTMAIADLMDDFGRHSKFERGLKGAAANFGMVSLMAPWNSAMKQFSGLVTMSRILQNAETAAKTGKLDPKELEAMASSGIDIDGARRIWKQFESRGGKIEDGVYLPNTEGWDDIGAKEMLRIAIARDVDRIVVTPGQEKPLFMSSDLGRIIFQFKSFAVSSGQRTLLSGLQQRDMAVLNGAVLAMGLGALAEYIKATQAGREIPQTPEQWAVNAFDRSGLAGWFMEANNITEKFTRGQLGLARLTGKPVSRFASRNVMGALLGPSVGAVSDVFQTSGAIFKGDFRETDTRAMRRLLGYQNVFYVRNLVDQAEVGINSLLGIESGSER